MKLSPKTKTIWHLPIILKASTSTIIVEHLKDIYPLYGANNYARKGTLCNTFRRDRIYRSIELLRAQRLMRLGDTLLPIWLTTRYSRRIGARRMHGDVLVRWGWELRVKSLRSILTEKINSKLGDWDILGNLTFTVDVKPIWLKWWCCSQQNPYGGITVML